MDQRECLVLDHEAAGTALAILRSAQSLTSKVAELTVQDGEDDDDGDIDDEDDDDEEEPEDAEIVDEEALGEDDGEGDDAVMPLAADVTRGKSLEDDYNDDVDEASLMKAAPRSRPEDESEFDSLLAATMHESLESRKLTAKVSVDNMTVPMHLFRKKEPGVLRVALDGSGASGDDTASPGPSGVAFKLLRKKGRGGNKIEVRELVVPESAALAKYSSKAQEAAKKEAAEVKRRVLQVGEVGRRGFMQCVLW